MTKSVTRCDSCLHDVVGNWERLHMGTCAKDMKPEDCKVYQRAPQCTGCRAFIRPYAAIPPLDPIPVPPACATCHEFMLKCGYYLVHEDTLTEIVLPDGSPNGRFIRFDTPRTAAWLKKYIAKEVSNHGNESLH